MEVEITAEAYVYIHLNVLKEQIKIKIKKEWQVNTNFLSVQELHKNLIGGFRNNICQLGGPLVGIVAVVLWFLASGDSFTRLQYLFRISKQTISEIIIGRDFEKNLELTSCFGCIDDKHIDIQA
ncbi:hypothetical protein PR048_013081 [Dryococelus australis]|uniref:ABC transmembrane type-1 domain-containing protein n=1 Tax=Dryococelus australis TaxID=614101 RepID=A0ABQ9HRY9_9NEOP|nr:hypothetical protein PR048_013081 [Dryococelus australis]